MSGPWPSRNAFSSRAAPGSSARRWCARLVDQTPHARAVFDKLTYAGNLASLGRSPPSPPLPVSRRPTSATRQAVRAAFERFQPEPSCILPPRAMSTARSTGPAAFIETNVVGTFTLLEAALRHWRELDGAGAQKLPLPPHLDRRGVRLARRRRACSREDNALRAELALFRLQGRRRTIWCAPGTTPTACRSSPPTAPTITGPIISPRS